MVLVMITSSLRMRILIRFEGMETKVWFLGFREIEIEIGDTLIAQIGNEKETTIELLLCYFY